MLNYLFKVMEVFIFLIAILLHWLDSTSFSAFATQIPFTHPTLLLPLYPPFLVVSPRAPVWASAICHFLDVSVTYCFVSISPKLEFCKSVLLQL
jgi:hypothetical protein